MAGPSNFLEDPRGKRLAILAGITAAAVLLAIVALALRAAEVGRKFEPRAFFAGLDAKLDQVAALRVETAGESFTIRHDTGKGWIVPEKSGYPADVEQVRKTVLGLVALEAIEPKTARAEWHGVLGLDDPKKENGAVGLTLQDAAGETLAAILIGNTVSIGDTTGRVGLYVRRPGEDQTWLARGFLTPQRSVSEWLDRRVLSIGRERIKEAKVRPLAGPAYTVFREKKDEGDFKLAEMPKGRELTYDTAPNGPAAAIVGFAFDDVAPASAIDFAKAAETETTTFDGLAIAVRIAEQAGAYWAVIGAKSASAETEAEARAINARVAPWAYKLPEYKAKLFLTERDSLLKGTAK